MIISFSLKAIHIGDAWHCGAEFKSISISTRRLVSMICLMNALRCVWGLPLHCCNITLCTLYMAIVRPFLASSTSSAVCPMATKNRELGGWHQSYFGNITHRFVKSDLCLSLSQSLWIPRSLADVSDKTPTPGNARRSSSNKTLNTEKCNSDNNSAATATEPIIVHRRHNKHHTQCCSPDNLPEWKWINANIENKQINQQQQPKTGWSINDQHPTFHR